MFIVCKCLLILNIVVLESRTKLQRNGPKLQEFCCEYETFHFLSGVFKLESVEEFRKGNIKIINSNHRNYKNVMN